jgi:hypothetical protein
MVSPDALSVGPRLSAMRAGAFRAPMAALFPVRAGKLLGLGLSSICAEQV